MARIAGIDLPKEKRVEIGLTYIYGIGRKSANDILAQTGINPDTRVKDLTDEEEAKLREAIDKGYMVEGDLRRNNALDIKRLIEIGCYRGTRHRKGLPVRGQRSKTNARTRKGPKKTIANKKKDVYKRQVPYLLPRDGLQGRNPRRAQGQLVKALILPGGAGFLPWSAQA